ncbi:MAG: ribbon-helix-helix domain-containing protein [Candidatus Thermoplasmatota archaeon]|nr:ribbon-helix-helix domain-containing protein [Candidatus Thermoplasmatota archaeon]
MSDVWSDGRSLVMADTERITIRLPEEIVAQLQQLVDAGKYSNKSDAIREAITKFLNVEIKLPNVEKLTLDIPKGNLAKLQELVNAGDSVSVDDAVRDAIKEYTRLRIQKMMEEYEEIQKIKKLE